MCIKSQRQQRKSKGGFTLVELLLTVGLILLLAGAVVFNLGSMERTARLDESATLVESLLRYARAQASSRGREVMVVFDDAPILGAVASSKGNSSTPSNGSGAATPAPVASTPASSTVPAATGVQVLWEPDPIGAPGKFEPLPGAYSLTEQLNDLVRVREVRPPSLETDPAHPVASSDTDAAFHESGANAPSAGSSTNAPSATRPVKFFPDGSSDSAEIVLGDLDDQSTRRLLVTLSGTTGILKHRFFNLGTDGTASTEPTTPAAVAEGNPGAQP